MGFLLGSDEIGLSPEALVVVVVVVGGRGNRPFERDPRIFLAVLREI